MLTQSDFLERIWNEIIRSGSDGKWIDAVIARAAKSKDTAEKSIGSLLAKLLEKGISRQEIVNLLQWDRRDTAFGIVHLVEVEGVELEAWQGIHETILTADPGPAPDQGLPVVDAKPPLLEVGQSHALAFAPDGTRVVAAKGGRIWDIATRTAYAKCELPPHTSHVAWSPDGSLIALMSTSGAIRLCDATTGQKQAEVKMKGEGSIMTFSPDGQRLICGDWYGTVYIWEMPSGKLLHERCILEKQSVKALAATKNGVQICLRSEPFPTVLELDSTLETEHWRYALPQGFEHPVLRPAGKMVLGLCGKTFVVFSTGSGKVAREVPISLPEKGYAKALAGFTEGIAIIWDAEFIFFNHQLKVIARRSIPYANDISFSADGKRIALSSWAKGQVWKLADLLSK